MLPVFLNGIIYLILFYFTITCIRICKSTSSLKVYLYIKSFFFSIIINRFNQPRQINMECLLKQFCYHEKTNLGDL
ncbi:hypothetical protein BMETH_1494_0 [methanotrophic bacterial endosymbiont of Bathymodiolus sp.]|nr:hypothetical protein BMETH_1494_0 [methanotrophic bacterial endosymbiont of Bathymodiolus sp.]